LKFACRIHAKQDIASDLPKRFVLTDLRRHQIKKMTGGPSRTRHNRIGHQSEIRNKAAGYLLPT
jgi:hypothetical protein